MELFLRLLFSIGVTLLIVKKAIKKNTLSRSGSVAAIFVGFFISLSSLCHFMALLAFFHASNRATKYKQQEKKKFDPEFKEGGQRDATQVLCNGFFATFFSILYLVDCGYGERPIDFAYDYKSTRYSLAILGTLCCSCGDTLASELGTALNSNSKTVFHVIKWKRVPKGVNGGISFYGTLSSGLGGLVVASAYFIMLQLCFLFQSLFGSSGPEAHVEQWPIIIIGTLSGLVGSLIDSLLGGYFQYSGVNRRTGAISHQSDEDSDHISGISLLSNNQVNLLSCFLMSLLTPYYSFRYYKNLTLSR